MAKLIINESTLQRLVRFQQLNEEVTKKDIADFIKSDKDFLNRVKDIMHDGYKTDKELEKKIKNITCDVLNKFFKTLWQRSNFLDTELRN